MKRQSNMAELYTFHSILGVYLKKVNQKWERRTREKVPQNIGLMILKDFFLFFSYNLTLPPQYINEIGSEV